MCIYIYISGRNSEAVDSTKGVKSYCSTWSNPAFLFFWSSGTPLWLDIQWSQWRERFAGVSIFRRFPWGWGAWGAKELRIEFPHMIVIYTFLMMIFHGLQACWNFGCLLFWCPWSSLCSCFESSKRLSFKNCDKLCSYIMRLSVCSCGNDSHHGEKNKHVGSRSCVLLESMVLTFCSCRTWYMDKSIIPSFWCFKAMVHQASCPVGRAGNSRSRRDAQEGWLMVKDGDIIYPIQYAPCMEYVSTFTPKSS